MKISAVINTFNEEANLKRCLESVRDLVDEVVVVDMHSTDKTVAMAKKFGAKVFQHQYTRFVEPARNFALRQAQGDWILVIDADEELSSGLAEILKEIAAKNEAGFVEIPRKNIIFGKWINHSRWWPDYLVRFFKKGKVNFSERIHSSPKTEGEGIKLEATEENALIHHNFQSISQFIERLNRYTDIQAEELLNSNQKFNWQDLIVKPADEFFSRFFAAEGYKDGLHGLALALLQSFSELVLYLKVWEKEGFKEEKIEAIDQEMEKVIHDYLYWRQKTASGIFEKLRFKLKSKI
ncbi:MAG TPA: glycosyltransferase family 2 protein [Clostridia bacterium]|nr:glycosyltransferase family 2 protein [Clostridia bacterium]